MSSQGVLMVYLQRPGRPRRTARLLFQLAGAALLCSMLSCGKNSSGNERSSGGTSTVREKASRVENFLINYGSWDAASIAIARHYDVVVVHPSQGLTRDIVEQIQQGVDPSD